MRAYIDRILQAIELAFAKLPTSGVTGSDDIQGRMSAHTVRVTGDDSRLPPDERERGPYTACLRTSVDLCSRHGVRISQPV